MALLRSGRAVFSLIGMILAIPAYAGTIRHDRSDSPYITLGGQYPSVGKLLWTENGGSYLASGTLIHENWVLTAGHVTGGNGQTGTFTINNSSYGITDWISHPSWTGELSHGYDIGLVRLSTPVSNIAPAIMYAGDSELGMTGASVGFGATGTGKMGYQSVTAGTKRAGTNVFDATSSTIGWSNNHYLLADFDDPSNKDRKNSLNGSSTPTDLEYSVAPGDSGGGTFVNVGGSQQLAGVNSFIAALRRPAGDGVANASYSDIFGVTRLSLFADWINQTISSVEGSLATTAPLYALTGGEQMASSVVVAHTAMQAVPEPASMGLMLSALTVICIWAMPKLRYRHVTARP